MASILFLKSLPRIMVLTAIMTLCLLIYAALEYRIRKAQQTFPNQPGKAVTKSTTRWVFQCLPGIHILIVDQVQTVVLNTQYE